MDRVDVLIRERRDGIDRGTLMIASAGLTDAELQAILADPQVGALSDLSLHRNALTVDGMRAIAASDKLGALTNLNVSMNPIGDDGIAVLAGSSVLAPVQRLNLSAVGATEASVASLAHVRASELDLGFQDLGDAGAVALAGLPARSKLMLQQAAIGGPGARALIAGTHAHSMLLEENPVGPGGLQGLEEISPDLISLDLTSCGLNAADLEALSAVGAPSLRSLVLDYNPAGDTGLHALAGAPWLGELQFLSVMGSKGGPEARAALRRAWGQRDGLTLEP